MHSRQSMLLVSPSNTYIKDITRSYCSINYFLLPSLLLAKVITLHVNQVWKRVFALEVEFKSELKGYAVGTS